MNTHGIKLASVILDIETHGTRIASFDYHGKKRNVVIGANTPPRNNWGEKVGRSLVAHKGRCYLVPLVRNDTTKYKSFDLEYINNFKCNGII